MPLVSDSLTLATWIRDHTADAVCVVDFGAGFFDKFRYVPYHCRKVGIEVFPAYLGYAPPGVKAVLGDMRDWSRFIDPPERDVAMLIDTLEHLPRYDGAKLLEELLQEFRRVLVMTPDGFVEQNDDVTGYENEWQKHESGWNQADLEAFGFKVAVAENFHKDLGRNALFAVAERN